MTLLKTIDSKFSVSGHKVRDRFSMFYNAKPDPDFVKNWPKRKYSEH